jgi:hypothetical protein
LLVPAALTVPIGIVTTTEFLVLIPAGTALPAQASQSFLSAESDQLSVRGVCLEVTFAALEQRIALRVVDRTDARLSVC